MKDGEPKIRRRYSMGINKERTKKQRVEMLDRRIEQFELMIQKSQSKLTRFKDEKRKLEKEHS